MKLISNGCQPPAPTPIAGEHRRNKTERIDQTIDEETKIERQKRPLKDEEEQQEE
jgi:hypothetical protein